MRPAVSGRSSASGAAQSEGDRMGGSSSICVRRQSFWNQWRPKLRESSAHLVGLIMRRAGGDASDAFRVSFV